MALLELKALVLELCPKVGWAPWAEDGDVDGFDGEVACWAIRLALVSESTPPQSKLVSLRFFIFHSLVEFLS
jgi:hypothetical protein